MPMTSRELNAEVVSLYVRLGGTSTREGRVLRALIARQREFRDVLKWYAGAHRPEERLDDNGERAQKIIDKHE